ncbi:MAG: metallophosphoesterase, partial [Planctomycetota bacterium]
MGAIGAFLYAWRVEPHWVDVVHRKLPIRGLPNDLDGKRLVQLSDLHAGEIVDQDFLKDALRRVGDLHPDAILMTGDYMSCVGLEQVDQAMDAIAALPAAPLGRFAVLGNHDYGLHWQRADVADRLSADLRGAGIKVLRN